MLVGGISCRSAYAEEIHERVAEIRSTGLYSDSLQWKHFRPEKFSTYKKLIDFFLEANSEQKIDYSCIIVDTKSLDHRKFNKGDGEAFFHKVMYLVAVSIARKFRYPKAIRLFHGKRDSSYDLEEVKRIINAGLASERMDVIYRPVRQLDYMDVGSSGPHQLTDTLLGATSYYWNSGQRRDGQSRKRLLAEYINSECCAVSLGAVTPRSKPHFDIWKMRLK